MKHRILPVLVHKSYWVVACRVSLLCRSAVSVYKQCPQWCLWKYLPDFAQVVIFLMLSPRFVDFALFCVYSSIHLLKKKRPIVPGEVQEIIFTVDSIWNLEKHIIMWTCYGITSIQKLIIQYHSRKHRDECNCLKVIISFYGHRVVIFIRDYGNIKKDFRFLSQRSRHTWGLYLVRVSLSNIMHRFLLVQWNN